MKKPILCLAPMADVTDRAFRQIIAKYSKHLNLSRTRLDNQNNLYLQQKNMSRRVLDRFVTWTEFVSADGLFRGGRKALINDLSFSEEERPIVAQFFTSKPEMMERAAYLAVELGFDGVDINMGCPDKSVEKQGAGAALIKNNCLACELIQAAKQGASRGALAKWGNAKMAIPVSVKTRIGYNKNELEKWLPNLLSAEPAVITIHARTRKEMSLVPARWEHIKRAVEIRNEIWKVAQKSSSQKSLRVSLPTEVGSARLSFEDFSGQQKTLIIGNGDVLDIFDAYKKAEESGCDGVMLGRAIFGKPYLLSNSYEWFNQKNDIEVIKKTLKILVEHTKLFEKLVQPKPPIGQGKSFAVMKKHFKAYVSGWDGAKELRIKLMNAENAKEVEKIVSKFLKE